jgi:hypothetical protein
VLPAKLHFPHRLFNQNHVRDCISGVFTPPRTGPGSRPHAPSRSRMTPPRPEFFTVRKPTGPPTHQLSSNPRRLAPSSTPIPIHLPFPQHTGITPASSITERQRPPSPVSAEDANQPHPAPKNASLPCACLKRHRQVPVWFSLREHHRAIREAYRQSLARTSRAAEKTPRAAALRQQRPTPPIPTPARVHTPRSRRSPRRIPPRGPRRNHRCRHRCASAPRGGTR